MIRLSQLLNEETFTAINKATGKTSVFKTKDSRDAAVKAGTHDKDEKAAKGGDAPAAEKPNMFSKDAGYDAPDTKTDKPKKSEPFDADRDEADFENALEGDGFSWYGGGSLEGVTTFGDENGNTVAIAAGDVYDSKSAFVVSGYNDNDPADVQSKEFNSKKDAIAYAKELGQKLKKQNPTQNSEPTSDNSNATAGLLPSQSETGVFHWTTGKLKPKKADKKLVSLVNKLSRKAKLDPNKISHEEYEKRMLSLVHDALEDANFHGANRQIFADLQGKPELAKRPDYSKAPEMGTPEREEWNMNNSIYNKTFDSITSEFEGSNDFATTLSSESGWDGEQTIAALLMKMRNDGHGNLADKIQASFDKAMENNEGRIKLTSLIKK